MNKRILPDDEIRRVIAYAYLNEYEPRECINLLDSKGLHNETVESVTERYNKTSFSIKNGAHWP